MFGFLLMMAMNGLFDFGSDKNVIGKFDGAWSSGPRGTETCDFGGRLETACSGIKFCLCV